MSGFNITSGKDHSKTNIKMGHVFFKGHFSFAFFWMNHLGGLKAFCVDDNKASTKDVKLETVLVTNVLGKKLIECGLMM